MLKKLCKIPLIFIALTAVFLSCPEVKAAFPKTQGYVSDFAGMIPSNTAGQLRTLAQDLERKTGAELAVVTVPDLGGENLETYAVDLFEKWGIGKKGKDNGVLILVAKAERKIRIEVGYGLEGIIPDGRAGDIIREQIEPAFKAGDFGAGLLLGAVAVSQIIAHDAGVQLGLKKPRATYGRRRTRRGSLLGSLINLIFFIIFFPLFFLRRLFFGHRRMGYWTSGLGGFGGGFGGGGFGGFGGGMSGGGGASGGW
jgi:uncharacterized protein